MRDDYNLFLIIIFFFISIENKKKFYKNIHDKLYNDDVENIKKK